MPGRKSHYKIGQGFSLLEPSNEGVTLSTCGWAVFWTIVTFSLFGVTGGGVAWWMFAQHYNDYYWTVSGNVENAGAVTNVLIRCTNATLSSTTIDIKNHRAVAYYYTCPEPRNTCEIAVCGADGICFSDLADGAQCSVNQDCIDLFNSTLYNCGSDCLCTNASDWYLSGALDVSGDSVSYVTTCSNETFSPQQSKINGGKIVSIYNPCPQPRSTCEASFCGGDGLCSFVLSNNSECASNRDCTDLYNSTAYTCGSDCLCTNSSQASFAYIKFTPQNVSLSSGEYNEPWSYYFYRAIGDVLEFQAQIEISAMISTPGYQFITIDISNLPYNLLFVTEFGVGYGSITTFVLHPGDKIGFVGIEGYALTATKIQFALEWDYSSTTTNETIYFNGGFYGRFT